MRLSFLSSSSSSYSSSSLPHHHLYTSSYSSSSRLRGVVSCCLNNKKNKIKSNNNDKVEFKKIPARDIVIDFGKHKGKMLGMLPSDYLKWMSTNPLMNTKGDFDKWGKLAKVVLEDEVYADRIQWELAEKLLTGDQPSSSSSGSSSGYGVAQQLEEIGKRFGWDYNDKSGAWSKLDFRLLGTSKGARLPRVKQPVIELQLEQTKPIASYAAVGAVGAVGADRKKRRERIAKRREKQIQLMGNNQLQQKEETNEIAKDEERPARFPGRQSLISKLNYS